MTPLIHPLLSNEAKLEFAPKTAPNPLADKINDYIVNLVTWLTPLFLSFKTGELSRRVYEIVQISLSTLGCAGYVVTLLICVGGFTKIAVVTALLSTANFVGAYVAYQATIQQSLEQSTRLFEKHLDELGQINTELKVTSEDLKKTNQDLKEQVSLFEEQNLELRDNIYDLEAANGVLHHEIGLLSREIQTLRCCNQELRETTETLKTQIDLFASQNQQWRDFAHVCKREAEQFFSEGREYNHTQAQLLQKFAEQITTSDQVWDGVFSGMREQTETQTQLIQLQMEALSELRNNEVAQALRKDIENASLEFKNLLEEIRKERLVLAGLEEAHQQILGEYRALLTTHAEQTQRLGSYVAALPPQAPTKSEQPGPGAAQGAP